MGRPTDYTESLGDTILARLLIPESLRKICSDEEMPDRGTVIRWIQRDEAFAAKYARARVDQADTMDDLILEVADATTPENAAASRVKIDAYKWRASKLKPKVYGDAVTLKGDKNNPLHVSGQFDMTEAELLKIANGKPSG